jgi:hypothetical protein
VAVFSCDEVCVLGKVLTINAVKGRAEEEDEEEELRKLQAEMAM